MKKLIAVIAMTMSVGVHATAKQDAICAKMGELASNVMRMRQDGYALVDALATNPSAGSNNGQIYRGMILDAFDMTVYSTTKYKNNTITQFGNKYHLACLKLK